MLEIFTAVMLLVPVAAATWLYILWIEQELRRDPADRNRVAHAIISTWEAIRSGVEWAFNRVGFTGRT